MTDGEMRRRAATRGRVAACLFACCFALCTAAAAGRAQNRKPLQPVVPTEREAPHRIRLALKDGGYQWVLSYSVKGDVVRYRSAERDGAVEDIPLALVDLAATKEWERAHDPNQPQEAQQAPVLSPELAREEAAREAQEPVVATTASGDTLRLPEDDSVLVLDTFQGTPELVPLPQQNSDLNKETAHAVQPKEVNPAASPHDMLFVKDERADVQLHVSEPVFYVRLNNGSAADADGGSAFVVDTNGQGGRAVPAGGAPRSEYLVERVDVRRGERAVTSPLLRQLDEGKAQADVIELRKEPLPGGVWEKLTPVQPLLFGEYVLLEVLNGHTVNASVWDFGVHSAAKENDEAIRPEPKRPARLQRREP